MYDLSHTIAYFLTFIQWLTVCVVATEAATEIVVDSKLFQPLLAKIKCIAYPENAPPPNTPKRIFFAWLTALTSCGYCFSVWVAGFFAPLMAWYPLFPGWRWGTILWVVRLLFVWLAYTMLIHRLSNWIHVAIEIHKRGRVNTYDHTVRMTEEVSG